MNHCRMLLFIAIWLASYLPARAQDGAPVPQIAEALLDAAYQTGDPAEIEAVTRAVKTVFMDYEAAIEARTQSVLAQLEPASEPTLDDDAPPPPAKGFLAVAPWKGKINAGAALASGNSDNFSAGVAIDAARTAGDWVHNFNAFIDYAETNDITNQKRWGASYQLDYLFLDDTYFYGRLSYEEDDFSGFEFRVFGGAGIGHYLYRTEPFTWKLEGGPGYRYSPIDGSDRIEREFAVYGASELDWLIRDGLIFEQDVNTTWTAPTTTIQSLTSLTTALTENLSTGLSFEYRYETMPPLGRLKSDKIARASLVYGF